MERISQIIADTEATVRVYLMKKRGYKGNYGAVLFPNAIDSIIKTTYAENYTNFTRDRAVAEYDNVHSEKGTIKRLPLSDLTYWVNILEAITIADRDKIILNKENFTDSYSAIVLLYEKVIDETVHLAYLIAQYRKIDTWYKRGVKFGFTTNTIVSKSENIFVLNGCIDTAIINEDAFVLQETAFEKVFNYYEKSKKTVTSNKMGIESWMFIDNPAEFYASVENKKGPISKLSRALDKSVCNFATLSPKVVREALSGHPEFAVLTVLKNKLCKRN